MKRAGDIGGASLAIRLSLCTAVVFEVLTLPETQIRSIWTVSPWREDPYHTAVWLAQVVVPVLALVIGLRRHTAGRAPGGTDRVEQMARAAAATIAVIGLALVSEWAGVIIGEPANQWTIGTWVQVGGLVGASSLALAATTLLLQGRQGRSAGRRPWQTDWLGDIVFLCRDIPVLRNCVDQQTAAWVRHRARLVFVMLSVAAGVAVTGGQAFSERVANPWLLGWTLVATTACFFAFCVISNAVAGFIARPPDTQLRGITETSVVTGCIALVAAIAFHDPLWSVLGSGTLTIGSLTALTLGPGLTTSTVTAVLLIARSSNATNRL